MKVRLFRNEERKIQIGAGKFERKSFRTPVAVMTNTPDKHQHEADKNGVMNLEVEDIRLAVAHGLEVEPVGENAKLPDLTLVKADKKPKADKTEDE